MTKFVKTLEIIVVTAAIVVVLLDVFIWRP
jgi:hypothetical protein